MNKTSKRVLLAITSMLVWAWVACFFNSLLPELWLLRAWYGPALMFTEVGGGALIFLAWMFYDMDHR